MINKKNLKGILIILIIVASFALFFYWWYFYPTKGEGLNADDIPTEPKHYEANEYSKVLISDESMCNKYLNNYLNIVSTDLQRAYNLLDEEYKTKKFGSLDNFKSYVDGLEYSTYVLSRYYKKDTDGYIIFGVYDKNGNFFAFKTKGVLQYTVFLDDYTVEIW